MVNKPLANPSKAAGVAAFASATSFFGDRLTRSFCRRRPPPPAADSMSASPATADNAALRAALVRGALAVTVSATDVRRGPDHAILGGLVVPVETDYILRVAPAAGGGGGDDRPALAAYACSKRYVDVRNLAGALRRAAETTLRHCERTASGGWEGGHGSGGSGIGHRGHWLLPTFLARGDHASLAYDAELEAMDRQGPGGARGGAARRPSSFGSGSGHGSNARLSARAPGGTPDGVRAVLEGVDGFHEAICSERRQLLRRDKQDFDHVRRKAARRRAVLDAAFAGLLRALRTADATAAQGAGAPAVPPSLAPLVACLEDFLATDVVVADDEDEDGDGAAPPQDAKVKVSRGRRPRRPR